jgi:hypothetical protein
MMRFAKIKPYLVYVAAFSLVCSLASALQIALNAWSWGDTLWSFSLLSSVIFHFPGFLFYAVMQLVAAVLTVRQLSLRKLFYLSCVFTIVVALLLGFERQMMDALGDLSFALTLGSCLPYVAPIIILALTGRKRTELETSRGIETETRSTAEESEVPGGNQTMGRLKGLYRRYWYVFDIVLAVAVFLYGTLNDPFEIIMYVCGLYNQLAIRAMMTFMWVMWLLPAALCCVVLLLRAVMTWPKHIRSKGRLLLLRVGVVGGLSIYLMLPFLPVGPTGFDVYIKGFEKFVRARADIAGIRNWLGTLGPNDCVVYNITNAHDGSKSSSPKDLQEQEWPGVISKLKPRYVTLSLDDDDHPRVRLTWGSGFLGTWGLVVGDETMPTPESDFSQYGEFRKEIRKGAYVWYGLD